MEGDIIYLKSKKKKASKPYTVYVVKDGDSMHGISQKYGIRLKNLYKMNRKDGEYVPEIDCVCGRDFSQKFRISET